MSKIKKDEEIGQAILDIFKNWPDGNTYSQEDMNHLTEAVVEIGKAVEGILTKTDPESVRRSCQISADEFRKEKRQASPFIDVLNPLDITNISNYVTATNATEAILTTKDEENPPYEYVFDTTHYDDSRYHGASHIDALGYVLKLAKEGDDEAKSIINMFDEHTLYLKNRSKK